MIDGGASRPAAYPRLGAGACNGGGEVEVEAKAAAEASPSGADARAWRERVYDEGRMSWVWEAEVSSLSAEREMVETGAGATARYGCGIGP